MEGGSINFFICEKYQASIYRKKSINLLQYSNNNDGLQYGVVISILL